MGEMKSPALRFLPYENIISVFYINVLENIVEDSFVRLDCLSFKEYNEK